MAWEWSVEDCAGRQSFDAMARLRVSLSSSVSPDRVGLRPTLDAWGAVSYTHLDVYKRQVLLRWLGWTCAGVMLLATIIMFVTAFAA